MPWLVVGVQLDNWMSERFPLYLGIMKQDIRLSSLVCDCGSIQTFGYIMLSRKSRSIPVMVKIVLTISKRSTVLNTVLNEGLYFEGLIILEIQNNLVVSSVQYKIFRTLFLSNTA